MPKMTKAQEREYVRLCAVRGVAQDAVYAAGHPRTDIPWNQCYAMASENVRDSYDQSERALRNFEQRMVDERRGWMDRGVFRPY